MIPNKSQIKSLRAEAHRLKLKPVVMIGQNGLSESVTAELEQAITHHELIKIRVPALEKADKKEMIKVICDHHQANLVQAIGNIAVIYRRNPDNDRYARLMSA